VSRIELGLGGAVSIDAWQRLGLAVGRPIHISIQRDPLGETADAGHLAMQELVLRLGGGRATPARSSWPPSRPSRGGPRTSGWRRPPSAG